MSMRMWAKVFIGVAVGFAAYYLLVFLNVL